MRHDRSRRTPLRLRRFEVVEESMLPSLAPGDYLVAASGVPVAAGDVVVFEHPACTGFWLVKRVTEIWDDRAVVLSDNQAASRADSRTFGAVPVAALHRVVLRYWPIGRVTVRFRRR